MTSLDDWLNYLTTLHPNAIDLGLERVGQVAEKLSLIHFSCPVITVAGTNGKGSTVAMLAAIYQTAGYKTATYTSPHLLNFTERLLIQGNAMAESVWCEAFAAIEEARGEVSLTYFEFSTLAALLIVKQQAVDVIILEVGMGGRLDAVNVVESDVTVVTSIALDHMEYLGADREAIGFEKAGIFRPRKPAVCGDPQPPQSLIETAERLSSPLFCQHIEFFYKKDNNGWRWWNPHLEIQHLPIPRLPLQNAATVLQVVYLLQVKLPVTTSAIMKALANVQLAGRMQKLAAPMVTILDVAHNPHAAQLLAENLVAIQPAPRRWVAIVGMLKDKDIAGTVAPLVPLIRHWYVASLDGERGADQALIKTVLQQQGVTNMSGFASPNLAYQQALKDLSKDDAIIVFGSFYTVADVLKFEHEQ